MPHGFVFGLFDVNGYGVGRLALRAHRNVHAAAPCERARNGEVELIEAGEIALRPREAQGSGRDDLMQAHIVYARCAALPDANNNKAISQCRLATKSFLCFDLICPSSRPRITGGDVSIETITAPDKDKK